MSQRPSNMARKQRQCQRKENFDATRKSLRDNLLEKRREVPSQSSQEKQEKEEKQRQRNEKGGAIKKSLPEDNLLEKRREDTSQASQNAVVTAKEKQEKEEKQRQRKERWAIKHSLLLEKRPEDLSQSSQNAVVIAKLKRSMENISSNDTNYQLAATTQIRELLSTEGIPPNDRFEPEGISPIDLLIASETVPKILGFLAKDDQPQLQFEAAWALRNVASCSPEGAKVVIANGAVPMFVKLLSSARDNVLDQALCALHLLSDRSNDQIKAMIQAGVCEKLVELLSRQSSTVLMPALLIVKTIVTGDRFQTQFVSRVLPCLKQLLIEYNDNAIKRMACVIISDITAGDTNQIQAVIDRTGIILYLVQLLQHAEFNIKTEAARAISNATFRGSSDQIRFLVNKGCIKPLCDLLNCRESPTDPISVSLWGIRNILKAGKTDKENNCSSINEYEDIIYHLGGLARITNLQESENLLICNLAEKILSEYFLGQEYQNLAAGTDGNVPPGGFNFG